MCPLKYGNMTTLNVKLNEELNINKIGEYTRPFHITIYIILALEKISNNFNRKLRS